MPSPQVPDLVDRPPQQPRRRHQRQHREDHCRGVRRLPGAMASSLVGPLSIQHTRPAPLRLNRGQARKTHLFHQTRRAVSLFTPSEIAPTPSEAQTPPRSPEAGFVFEVYREQPRARTNLVLLCAESATS